MTKKDHKKLDWWNLTKDNLLINFFFYLITILSSVLNYIIDSNAINSLVEKAYNGSKKKFTINFFKFSKTFDSSKDFFIFFIFYIFIYFLVVQLHVYLSHHIKNKIAFDIRERLIRKNFSLSQENHKKQQFLASLNGDLINFSEMAIFVPNQIFYVLLSATLVFYGLLSDKKNQRVQKNLFFWGIVSFIAVAAVCSILNYIVYRRELSFQKTSETSKEKENFIINNQKIIVKKNLHEKFKEEYSSINENLKKKSNWRDFMYAISMVAPSYLLINYVEFILLPLICLNENYNPANLILLGRIFSQEKKIFERLKNYPYYFSAKKRLNLLLKKEERDDQESRVIIDEKIKKIELKNVSFSYPGKKEQVLNEFSYIFEIGKINKLVGKNGFGKSTIVEIIMGLNKISDGDVIVNDNYSLKDINLKNWREKIVYSEHNNLVANGISTGQKQWRDINESLSLANLPEKQLLIFDEADNALDTKNKRNFREKIKRLSESKIVIFISH